ncbi:ATP-binding cassette sub-family A member 1-like [Ctenocephalides felis]|uniref:ATP-binding cassette sub-family A member 1-like n=1 Tax=Ctenocephalides felis TaxID=7515 RepID=UPI000E6E4C2B|nr:ATP-binding cassette sub-family A member 1-like [Ctenocephalides felis]
MINKKSYHVTTSKKKARIDKIKPNIDDLDVFVERKIVESTLKDKWQQEVLYYPGQCFGICGEDGPSKKALFEILVGLDNPSAGDAYLMNTSLMKDRKKYMNNIGFSPCESALFTALTGREVVTFFTSLLGLSKHYQAKEIDFWISFLGLTKIQHSPCYRYPPGIKMKMSIFIAYLSNAPIIILDHPTKSVDPVSKHGIYTLLEYIQTSGKAIVMISDSMSDCDLLCSRLAILARGQFKCIGKIQDLKERFGVGYTAIVKTRATDSGEFNM